MKSKLGIPIEGFAEYSRYVATQGVVLLKNENNNLPLLESDKVSIFGRCQIEYYRSGTGSGGSVSTEYITNVLNSLKERNESMVNTKLAKVYEDWLIENPFDNGGGGWAAEPWKQKEMLLTEELVKEAREFGNKAIVILGRTAGEDKDNLNVKASYLLDDDELDMLDKVASEFDEICVVLNTSNIIDMSWSITYKDKIKSMLYTWNGGMEGGNATVDILLGEENPSGKLPDTVACSLEDYYSTNNYGSPKENYYCEDIYIGYRYFETFAKDRVLYPFGFGLSYTTFELGEVSLSNVGDISNKNNRGVVIKTDVKNTGEVAGREVVQVYMKAPQGAIGKPEKVLVGFAKTKKLEPLESENIEIFVEYNRMSSYDDSGETGFKSAYVLEAGDYEFFVGEDVRSAEKIDDVFYVPKVTVVEQLTEALAPIKDFKRIKPAELKENGDFDLVHEDVPTRSISLFDRIESNKPKDIAITGDKGILLTDVRDGKHSIEEFIAQLDENDLAIIVRGEGMSHPEVTPGTASAFAGVTNKLRKLMIPLICTADGPSGLRMEGGLKSTQVPIGTLLSATWDVDIIEELYTYEGKEMQRNCVDVLLGPGMNIHRNPLNGRNFEYFSEDPLLTGLMASAVVKGIAKSGTHATLKHFACNNQEFHRHDVDAIISERAVREIYLKCFEIAVKDGNAKSIMTAYNPINGHWTASNYDLNTTVLRNEWGFSGIVMTDWWAKLNDVVSGGEGTRENTCAMVKSQNDVYMVIGNFAAETNEYNDNTEESLKAGKLSLGELQRCAINLCNFAMHTNAIDRDFFLFSEPVLYAPNSKYEDCSELTSSVTRIEFDNDRNIKFNCAEAGIYQISLRYSLEVPELAQTTCKLRLNDNGMTVLQGNTTKGKVIQKRLSTVELKEGGYILGVDCDAEKFVTKGLVIEKL